MEAARRLGTLTREAEREAVDAALALLSSAAAACEQAGASAAALAGGEEDARAMREDAAANGARALCAAAGHMLEQGGGGGGGLGGSGAGAATAATAAASAALPLLDRAVALYESVLPAPAAESAEDDANLPPVEALTDLADALMQRAEARSSLAAAAAASVAVESDVARALELYARACGACDSAQGDDLPGLLHNWGVGLYTASRLAAAAAAASAAGAGPASAASLRLLGEAAGKLRASAAFARGDPQPHNALGDVLVALAERASGASGADEAAAVATAAGGGLLLLPQASSGDGGGGGDSDTSLIGRAAAATRADLAAHALSAPDLARALLRAAVAEGYGGALTLSRRDADGLVGCAEVAVLLGKAERAAGETTTATTRFAEAARLYAQALRDAPPAALGSAIEREAVAWNAACASALSGDVAGAAAALRVASAAGFSPADVLAEEDLRAVWSLDGWEEAAFGGGGGERERGV